jgi:hypothetical protein
MDSDTHIDNRECPAANIGLAIWRLTSFYETFVLSSTFEILMNFSAKKSATSPSRKPLAVIEK